MQCLQYGQQCRKMVLASVYRALDAPYPTLASISSSGTAASSSGSSSSSSRAGAAGEHHRGNVSSSSAAISSSSIGGADWLSSAAESSSSKHRRPSHGSRRLSGGALGTSARSISGRYVCVPVLLLVQSMNSIGVSSILELALFNESACIEG
jgi:hypothetical protein